MLSSEGYAGSNPEGIAQMKVQWVLKIRDYINFKRDYKLEYNILSDNEHR